MMRKAALKSILGGGNRKYSEIEVGTESVGLHVLKEGPVAVTHIQTGQLVKRHEQGPESHGGSLLCAWIFMGRFS